MRTRSRPCSTSSLQTSLRMAACHRLRWLVTATIWLMVAAHNFIPEARLLLGQRLVQALEQNREGVDVGRRPVLQRLAEPAAARRPQLQDPRPAVVGDVDEPGPAVLGV